MVSRNFNSHYNQIWEQIARKNAKFISSGAIEAKRALATGNYFRSKNTKQEANAKSIMHNAQCTMISELPVNTVPSSADFVLQ